MENSVLLIGIDGATWDLLKDWINMGHLPTLKGLVDSGSCGNLETVIPPLSCTAWTSLFTGKNPGKHGIFSYLTRSGKLINSNSVEEEKIWNILSDKGKRSCIINVPLTFPVEKLNGYMVSSFLTPTSEKIYSYPKELMSNLKKHDYRISIKNEKFAFVPDTEEMAGRRKELLEDIYDVLDKRRNTLKELMNEKWDFFFIVFNESSSVQYLFWDDKQIMLEFYKRLDGHLNELIEVYRRKNPKATVFIVSDHGYSASPKRNFNARSWLIKEGYVSDGRTTLQKLIPKLYKKINKTPVKFLFKLNKLKEIRESFQIKTAEALPVYFMYPGFYLDKENNRDELIHKLSDLRDPLTGQKVFKLVERRESIYRGRRINHAPHIVAIPNKNCAVIFSEDSDEVFEDSNYNHPGRHFSDLTGIFIASGPSIESTEIHASILDIFPTILHILDIPIPKDADGKVLKNIFKEDSELFTKKISYCESANQNEKSKIQSAAKNIKI